jgi:hypothetical protein
MSTPPPSYEQREIILAANRGESFSVDASAGTGKSTLLEMIDEQGDRNKSYVYIVFNKANAKEAKKKFNKHRVLVTTANSLGYRNIVGNNGDNLRNRISTHTYADISNAYQDVMKKNIHGMEPMVFYIGIEKTIGNFCISTDTEINETHVPPHYAREDCGVIISRARAYWLQACKFECLYTHDIYMKKWALSNPTLPFDCILYDEAQDTDPNMLKVVNAQTSQKIIVGDKYQQIYKFRGSLNAMDKFNVDGSYRLSQSYRYGEEIAGIANQIIERYYGVESNIKGCKQLDTKVSNSGYLRNPNESPNVIIARTNHQIIELMLEAKDANKKYYSYVETADIKQIIGSIWCLKNNQPPSHELFKGFDSYDELKELIRFGGNPVLKTYIDLYNLYGYTEIKNAIIESEKNAEYVSDRIHSKHINGLHEVYVSGHKCKGLEFDNVILHKDFYDSTHKKFNDDEKNLVYVASTRAQKNLDISRLNELCDIHDPRPIKQHINENK